MGQAGEVSEREMDMDEAEWAAGDDPGKLLRRARFRSSARKSRLFATACCRLVWRLLLDERSRKAVEVAERHADGAATDEELGTAAHAAHAARDLMFAAVGKSGSCLEWAAAYSADANPFRGAKNVSWMAQRPRVQEIRREQPDGSHRYRLVPCSITPSIGPLSPDGQWVVSIRNEVESTGADNPRQAALIRCIFGNPFRPVSRDPAWLSADVKALAHAAYDNRRLPGGELEAPQLLILADALEEAGCTEATLLDHLRVPAPHVRGCWAVDLLTLRK